MPISFCNEFERLSTSLHVDRAVVKSTFVESKTSPSPKRFESESRQSPKRFESESRPSPKRFESKCIIVCNDLKHVQQHCRIKLGYFIYPPETQLWSFCLCSGHSVLVYFSETSHVTVISLDVLYRAHSGLYRDNTCFINPLIRL